VHEFISGNYKVLKLFLNTLKFKWQTYAITCIFIVSRMLNLIFCWFYSRTWFNFSCEACIIVVCSQRGHTTLHRTSFFVIFILMQGILGTFIELSTSLFGKGYFFLSWINWPRSICTLRKMRCTRCGLYAWLFCSLGPSLVPHLVPCMGYKLNHWSHIVCVSSWVLAWVLILVGLLAFHILGVAS
jgi:hypothetical protein